MIDYVDLISRFPTHAWDWCCCLLASRRERLTELLLSVPAMLVSAVVIAGAVVVPPQSGRLLQALTTEAQQALLAGELGQAELLLSRLRQTGQNPESLEYEMATVYEQRGDLFNAERIMRALSLSLTSTGGKALKWRASRMLEQTPDDSTLVEAAEMLDQAIRLDPLDPKPYWLLGQIRFHRGELEEAAKHLKPLIPYEYRAGLMYIEACRHMQRPNEAQMTAEKTLKLLEQIPEAERNVNTTLAHGECLFFLNRDQEAIAVFEQGLDRFGDSALRIPLFLSCLRAASSSKLVADKINYLQTALKASPGSPVVLALLSRIAMNGGEKSSDAELILTSATTSDTQSSMHFVLGTTASKKGDDAAAIQHLRQALASIEQDKERLWNAPADPDAGPQERAIRDVQLRKLDLARCTIVNNLAWTLAHVRAPQLEEALRLADEICEQHAMVHAFRETRGQIRARLGHWPEAIEDLKFALEGLPKNPEIHATLAKAYAQTGNRFNAQMHERRARELASSEAGTVR